MTSSHSLHHVLLAAALTVGFSSFSSAAWSQAVDTGMLPNFAPQVGETTASEFARTQSETQLLRAQIDRTKAQVELATLEQQMNMILRGETEESKKAEQTPIVEETPPSLLPAPPVVDPVVEEPTPEAAAAQPSNNSIPAPPEVVAVFGSGDALFASLRTFDGRTFDVKKGDRIENGYRVQSITPETVTLNRDGKSYQLRIISSRALGVNLHREIPLNVR